MQFRALPGGPADAALFATLRVTIAYAQPHAQASEPFVILRHSFEPPDNNRLAHLCGSLDEHLRSIEAALGVSISRRNEFFRIEGGKVRAEAAMQVLQDLHRRADKPVSAEHVQLALVGVMAGRGGEAGPSAGSPAPPKTANAAPIHAAEPEPVLRTRRADLHGRTPNQLNYLRNIVGHDITFGIGPAGTGKTFLAVACAVDALERSSVQRIIVTRPAVEAGERLGFLPGDLAQKVDPYLRPLYDALYDLMGLEKVGKAFEKGSIEVAPLAFMRGRTLNNAFVILDEAQNTTPEQMKMFLTRIGFGAKAVVTGDVSQIDLPRGQLSGLIDAERILRRVKGIATTHFTSADVVRHPLVARIVDAYDAARSAES
jgi:phosphate starvation-inducible PhoH-like protein